MPTDAGRALVVDDEATFRRAAISVVAELEWFEHIDDASSGEEALEKLDSLAFDLVLLDVRMAGMSGVEAARLIRSRHPGVAVVLMSVSVAAALRSEAVALGVPIVAKGDLGPDTLEVLIGTLDRRVQ